MDQMFDKKLKNMADFHNGCTFRYYIKLFFFFQYMFLRAEALLSVVNLIAFISGVN